MPVSKGLHVSVHKVRGLHVNPRPTYRTQICQFIMDYISEFSRSGFTCNPLETGKCLDQSASVTADHECDKFYFMLKIDG